MKKTDINQELLSAAVACDPQRMEKLLQKGADPNVADMLGDNALTWVIRGSTPPEEIERYNAVAKQMHQQPIDKDDNPVKCLKLLLKAGANPNQRNNLQRTALRPAAETSATFTKLLLKKGADPDLQDVTGHTALMAAAVTGNAKSIKALIKYKADLDLQDNALRSALFWGIEHHQDLAVKALLKGKPDVDIQNKDGRTPLMMTIIDRDEEVFDLVLGAHPNLDIEDIRNQSAEDYAVSTAKSHTSCPPFSAKLRKRREEDAETAKQQQEEQAAQKAFNDKAKTQRRQQQHRGLRNFVHNKKTHRP